MIVRKKGDRIDHKNCAENGWRVHKINNAEGKLICIWKHGQKNSRVTEWEREKKMLYGFICEGKKSRLFPFMYTKSKQCLSQQRLYGTTAIVCCSFVCSFVWCVMDSTSAGISCHANINKQPNWIYEAKIVPQRTYGNNETNKPSEYDILKDGSRCARNVIRAMS